MNGSFPLRKGVLTGTYSLASMEADPGAYIFLEEAIMRSGMCSSEEESYSDS